MNRDTWADACGAVVAVGIVHPLVRREVWGFDVGFVLHHTQADGDLHGGFDGGSADL